MAKTVERRFSVLSEVISQENVQVMSELLSLIETKWLIGRVGDLALTIHHRLYSDVINKDIEGYTFTDSYDIVQTVALFLCEHFGERLDDYYYSTRNGKVVTIKYHCYRLVQRAVCTRYRRSRTETRFDKEDYTNVDNILSQLNLNDYYLTILNCRMSGMSFPEIGRIVNRQISTVWVALAKIRKQYMEIMQ